MSALSARLALPFLLPAQAQKHVTHNEALEQLDPIVQISVEGFERLLTKTIEAGRTSGAVEDKSLERVSVDATVMESGGGAWPQWGRVSPRNDRLSDRCAAL